MKYMTKKILFITATHGDEKLGVEILKDLNNKDLGSEFDSIIGNPKALQENKRFIEDDLNRIFPGKKTGNYEERRAVEIISVAKKYDWVIDIHGSVSPTGIFVIVTKFNLANMLLALRFDIKRIVIWADAPECTGSLSTFMPAGIEIESGYRDDPLIKKDLVKKLKKFLMNLDKNYNTIEELKKKEIYYYTGKLKKSDCQKPASLQNWKKINDYYPLFVDGQYSELWCYKFKKLEFK